MLRRNVPFHLLAPTTEGGGGGAAVADPMLESDPSAMSSWMKELPPLQTTTTTEKKEANGTDTNGTGGTGGSGQGAVSVQSKQPAGNAAVSTGTANAAMAGEAAKLAEAEKAKQEAAKSEEAKKAAETKAAEEVAAKEKEGKEAADKWPRSSADWERYKKVHAEKESKLQKEIDTRQETIKTLEAQVAEFQKKTVDAGQVAPEIQAQIDSLKKDNEEMSRRLQIVDVTQHPKFQAYFGRLVDNQKALAKNILGDKFTEFEKIVELPNGEHKNEQVEAFLENISTLQQSRIGNVLNRLDEIAEEKKQEIEKAGQHKETLSTQQKTAKDAAVKNRDKAIGEFVVNLEKNNPAYQPREGDEAWNTARNERIATAKRILTGEGLKPADIIKAAFDAAALPATLQAYKADMAEKDAEISKLAENVKGLEAQIAKLSAAQPNLNGGGSGAGNGNGTQPAGGSNRLTAGTTTPTEAMDSFTKGLWESQ